MRITTTRGGLQLSGARMLARSLRLVVASVPLTTLLGCGAATLKPTALPAPVSGEALRIESSAGALTCYVDGPQGGSAAPLLLIHSINAAGSAYEVQPLHEHYRHGRRVYSLELPGYGHSDRSERVYTLRMMTDAVLAMTAEIRRREGVTSIDALAVSLSSEFLARAASENPAAYRSLALVSPTGFDRRGPYNGAPGSSRGKAWLYRIFTVPLWRRSFFDVLTSRSSMRYFLEKTWGSKHIDEALFEYARLTTRDPDAHHVPYYFISGFLFGADISKVYAALTPPVWMSHGVRGDFVDYRNKKAFEGKSNWSFTVFDSGAMPHFERTREFIAAYDEFLEGFAKRQIDAAPTQHRI